MGALRIFRRNMEKKGKAIRKKFKFPASKLRSLPESIRAKANSLGNGVYSLTVWKLND